MGKKVFEVAKDLGVDHRDLLKKCDALDIKVRNYMSVLTDADEARLRSAYQGGSQVVERQQAPGVRVRRSRGGRDRSGARGSTSGASPRRADADAAASPRPATRTAPVRRSGGAEARRPDEQQPSPRPATPAKPEAPAAPAAPAASQQAAPPADATPAKPEAPAAPPAQPAAKAPAREAAAPVAKVLFRPEPPRTPQVKTDRGQASPRQIPKTVVARRAGEQKSGGNDRAASPRPASPRPASPRPASPRRVESGASPRRIDPKRREDAPRREGPPPRGDSPTSPRRRSGSVERRTSGGAQIRKPAPRDTGASAKILGRIPLEQLQRRTTRPPSRRSGPRRPARSGSGRVGPRRSSSAARIASAPMPPPTGQDQQRRRRTGGGSSPSGQRDRNRGGAGGGGGGGNRGRRRRVFNREDIYKGGGSQRSGRGRRRKMSSRKGAKTQLTTPAAHKRVVRVDETISVGELGKAMGVKATELMRKLMGMGVMATINQQIDLDTAGLLAGDYDYEVKNVAFQEDDVLSGPVAEEAVEADPDAEPRAPVVTIMGHVDHGKTTLLDRIRKANVAAGEAGGITQHVAAYKVKVGDRGVTFLDTPGHAAFTAMRARGASVTDIVVLIVAADDGVMPQTVESINHAKAAGVPIVVAVNKVDKPGVDVERIKQEMTKYELVPEEWGGDTIFVPVSALTGTGIDDLLEALVLQAEILELKANPAKSGYGRVVEARVDKGRGTVCTVLVQSGTLRTGDYIVSGNNFGRVRALIDDTGKRIKSAGPSTPVEVLGLGGMPSAGDAFYTASNQEDAKKVVNSREERDARTAVASAAGPADPMAALAAMGKPEKEVQNVILKTDVSGSLEALKGALEQIATDEVEVKLVHSGVGAISENDISLAIASEALVVGFNVKPDGKSKRAADQGGVEILTFSVIYAVLDTMKERLSGLLSPETVEEHLGEAEVRAVFHIQRVGTVAGCFVTEGKILRNAMARVHRGGEVIHTGKLSTLKRFKDDVREVASGYECGLSVDGYKDVQEGDRVEAFELKQIKRSID